MTRASASGEAGQTLLQLQLQVEADTGLRSWYARVPTECNLSDFPSRSQLHELLPTSLEVSCKAVEKLQFIVEMPQKTGKTQ